MATPAPSGTHVIFWNIRAGGGPSRAQAIALELIDEQPDIVCLCECRPTFAGQLAVVLQGAGLTHTLTTTTAPRTNAMLIASREPFDAAPSAHDRVATIRLSRFTLTAAHIPDASTPTARRPAWQTLHASARESRDEDHLIVGDLNADRDAAPNRDGVPLGKLAALGYTDLIARHAPASPPATWVGPRGQAARIDHAFASRPLVSQVETALVRAAPRDRGLSDHALLSVRLVHKDP